jgi:hypothetical protein
MAEGKGRDAWAHTSSILALLASGVPSIMVEKSNKNVKPEDFNPYFAKRKRDIVINSSNMDLLAREFEGLNKRKKNG